MKINDDYRVCFPDSNIFVSENHNWAFAAWEIAKNKKNIKPNATLFHVDAHLDDVWDGILVEDIYIAKTDEEVLMAAEQLKIENFIWAGFATDAINNIIYVTEKKGSMKINPFDFEGWDFQGEDRQLLKKLIRTKPYEGVRLEYIEELEQFREKPCSSKYIENKSLILDLDLDYFNVSDSTIYSELMDDEKIMANLIQLKDLHPWDLITVALSPLHCGGKEECLHLYKIFLDVFNLNESKAVTW